MKKKTSKVALLVRSFVLIPLTVVLLLGFSEAKVVSQETNGSTITQRLENNPDIELFNALAKKYNAIPVEKRKIPLEDLKILEGVYKKMTPQQRKKAEPFPECLPKNIQQTATPEQLAQYNALAKKYYELPIGNFIPLYISDKKYSRNATQKFAGLDASLGETLMTEIELMNHLYDLMSEEQKKEAEPFPFPDIDKLKASYRNRNKQHE